MNIKEHKYCLYGALANVSALQKQLNRIKLQSIILVNALARRKNQNRRDAEFKEYLKKYYPLLYNKTVAYINNRRFGEKKSERLARISSSRKRVSK